MDMTTNPMFISDTFAAAVNRRGLGFTMPTSPFWNRSFAELRAALRVGTLSAIRRDMSKFRKKYAPAYQNEDLKKSAKHFCYKTYKLKQALIESKARYCTSSFWNSIIYSV